MATEWEKKPDESGKQGGGEIGKQGGGMPREGGQGGQGGVGREGDKGGQQPPKTGDQPR